jgi:hypothetical protein
MLRGKASDVAAGMRRSATLRDLGPEERQRVDTRADTSSNTVRCCATTAIWARVGVIKGACRHLVKDRMDITGAGWRLRSAEAVFQRRYRGHRVFHKAQEHTRNHLSRVASHDFRKAG